MERNEIKGGGTELDGFSLRTICVNLSSTGLKKGEESGVGQETAVETVAENECRPGGQPKPSTSL